MMSNDSSPVQLAGAWCAAITVTGACAIVAGAALTVGNLELLLAACFVPPAVMLLIWRVPAPALAAIRPRG